MTVALEEPSGGEHATVRLDRFASHFSSLTGHEPFPWQRALYAEFASGRFPKVCDIPTGLGKTSIMAAWLLALAHHAARRSTSGFPRRLVYVVNRRTVVDQATREAERIREALTSKHELGDIAAALGSLAARASEAPLAISTLRGQFADNAEWRDDPARAAIVVGTVDMIGSRLLFSGYGRGFKSRPLHAAFLGQDSLLVHDEAHLEPAFQQLVTTIEAEQRRCHDPRPLRVMALTATSRAEGVEVHHITEEDREHCDVAKKRLRAKKGIRFHSVDDEKEIAAAIASLALAHRDSGQAILVFVKTVELVEKGAAAISKQKLPVQTLTGTMRGLERDSLANQNDVFARFMPRPSCTPREGTVYLISTSAGEVGIDISADHLVCDLTPFDSMAQRFGRVNRLGDGDARIDVVHVVASHEKPVADVEIVGEEEAPLEPGVDAQGDTSSELEDDDVRSPSERALDLTLSLLRRLPMRGDGLLDASPLALGGLSPGERLAAFTPPPVVLPARDIHFDAWAMTSIRHAMPGRPPVADWLHGVSAEEPPETHVAWREEVELITAGLLERYAPVDLLEDYPLKPHELLRDWSHRVFKHLKKLAGRMPQAPVWLVSLDGSVRPMTLGLLAAGTPEDVGGSIVLLPPSVGGLRREGLLDGSSAFQEGVPYDVADRWLAPDGRARRLRVWDDEAPTPGMRLVRALDIGAAGDDDDSDDGDADVGRRFWRWYVRPRSADDEGSSTATAPQELEAHLSSAERNAKVLAESLELGETESAAVIWAARWHDRGKDRSLWQRSIGNHEYPGRVLAKSGGAMNHAELSLYRHELGSMIELSADAGFSRLAPEAQDLALHLIAAHHGRARPHFPADEVFDPERTDAVARGLALEVPRRFARLQRRYGRWGLAYLESLVRAADALASQADAVEPSPERAAAAATEALS